VKRIGIVCFAWDVWSALWKPKQHLMHYLAQKAEVVSILFVDRDLYLSDMLPNPLTSLGDRASAGAWAKASLQSVQRINRKIGVYTPFHYLPFSHRPGPMRRMDTRLTYFFIARRLKKKDIEHLVLLVNRVVPLELLRQFRDAKLRCLCWSDDWATFKGISTPESVERRIEMLLKESDMVLAVSPELVERARKFTQSTYWLPNATDFGNFARASLAETEIAGEIVGIPRPILGLVGYVTSTLDFDLLVHVAKSRPEWSIVVIGPKLPAASWGESFFKMKNVYYLGPKPYFDLPMYMKGFDVCIIPYLTHRGVRAAESVKMYDYLATGKPVVASTDAAGIGRFSDVIRIGRDYDDFVRQLEQAIGETDSSRREARQKVAKENSWERRADEMYRLIRARLQ